MMKKILTAALLFASSLAFGATLNPIQLLSPAGSTSGQTIVSTGASAAPAWGNVTATGLAAQAANTVVANATGSTAAPTAFVMPSCSNANQALRWTAGTGFTCTSTMGATTSGLNQFAATTSAQLLGVISDETGTGSLVFGTSPTIASPTVSGTLAASAITASGLISPTSTVGIKGTTTNDSPAAGSIGEAPTNTTSGTSMTINTAANCTSLPLTAGNWLVWGMVTFTPNAATTVAQIIAVISTTSATLPTFGTYQALGLSFTTGANQSLSAMPQTVKLASSGTVYLVGQSSFSVNTMTCTGFIYALRIR